MESEKFVVLPTVLTGGDNYITWARTAKAVMNGCDLSTHIESLTTEVKKGATPEEVKETKAKWFKEDQAVLAILHMSLSASILEAYSYCDKAKQLWDTLENVFGNVTNLTRVFEVKKAINTTIQGDSDFNSFFGKFRSA